jgi:hypothetical protein
VPGFALLGEPKVITQLANFGETAFQPCIQGVSEGARARITLAPRAVGIKVRTASAALSSGRGRRPGAQSHAAVWVSPSKELHPAHRTARDLPARDVAAPGERIQPQRPCVLVRGGRDRAGPAATPAKRPAVTTRSRLATVAGSRTQALLPRPSFMKLPDPLPGAVILVLAGAVVTCIFAVGLIIGTASSQPVGSLSWLDVTKTAVGSLIGAFLGAGTAFATNLGIQEYTRRLDRIRAGNVALASLILRRATAHVHTSARTDVGR